MKHMHQSGCRGTSDLEDIVDMADHFPLFRVLCCCFFACGIFHNPCATGLGLLEKSELSILVGN